MKITRILILFSVLVSGCATEHDARLSELRQDYQKTCDHWAKTDGVFMTTRKPGEETIPVEEVISRRCSEDPAKCHPPTKPVELSNMEIMWNISSPTPESCNQR